MRSLLACGLTLSLPCVSLFLRADPIYWNGGNGTWYTAGNWSTGKLPTSLDDVFNTLGYNTIAIDNGSSQFAGTLTNNGILDISFGTLDIAGDVSSTTLFGSAATIQAHGTNSTVTLNSQGGNLTNGGVIQAYDGGTININTSGTLSNQAGSTLGADSAASNVGGMLVFNGAGALDNAGFIGSQILGSGGAISGSLTGAFTNESTGSLVLDNGSSLMLGSSGVVSVNAGVITVTNASALTLNAATFTNSRLIDASNGGNVNFAISSSLVNSANGVIATDYTSPANGSTLVFSGVGALDNAGFIGSTALGSGGSVSGSLTGAFTNASTGSIVLDSFSNLTLGGSAVNSSNAGAITVSDSYLTDNSFLTINARTFTNSGLIDASTEGQVTFNIAASLVNQAGATIATDYSVSNNGGTLVFAGAGSLNNAGFIGSMTLGSDGAVFGSLTGTFTNQSTGSLVLDSGSSLMLGNTGVASSNAGNITIYTSSTLTLNATTFTNTGTLSAADGGAIAINGAAVLVGGTVSVAANSALSATGVVTQTGGSTRVDGTFTAASNLQLEGGDFIGSGKIIGNVNNSGGTVQPGDLLGTLTINGNYTQTASGKTEIDLGGTQQGVTYDLLKVTSLATLGGELEVKATNGFIPQIGETFDFLSYGSLSGAFDTVVGLNTGYTYQVSFSNGIGTLTVAAVPEASTLLLGMWMLGAGGALLRRRQIRPQPAAPEPLRNL